MKARIEAFFREFPFVGRYVKKTDRFRPRPQVLRVDLDLLDRIPFTERWAGGYFPGFLRFLLISADGSEVGEVRQSDKVRRRFSIWHAGTWCRHETQGETVYEAIQRLADPDRVAAILEIEEKTIFIEVTLHKVPVGCSFSEWIAKIHETAEKELHGELAKIDED
jgi:hypothetical protein